MTFHLLAVHLRHADGSVDEEPLYRCWSDAPILPRGETLDIADVLYEVVAVRQLLPDLLGYEERAVVTTMYTVERLEPEPAVSYTKSPMGELTERLWATPMAAQVLSLHSRLETAREDLDRLRVAA